MPPSVVLSLTTAVNRSYVLPLAVMLDSLKQHLRPDFHPQLYLLHTGLPQSSLDLVSSIVETHPIRLSEEQIAAAPQHPSFPREASAPLLLAELLPPHLERVLFLDADMLVLDDLAPLWETPLGESVLAAVPDLAVPFSSSPRGVKGCQTLGIPPNATYFNAGLLLIHLERWRARQVTQRARHYLESTRQPIDFLHQEALNAVLWGDWKRLDPRWNLLASLTARPYNPSSSEAWRSPGIVHFAGRVKPWRTPIGGPFNQPYQTALSRMLPLVPAPPPTLPERLLGFYDRRLRAALYPLEQYLWTRRLL